MGLARLVKLNMEVRETNLVSGPYVISSLSEPALRALERRAHKPLQVVPYASPPRPPRDSKPSSGLHVLLTIRDAPPTGPYRDGGSGNKRVNCLSVR